MTPPFSRSPISSPRANGWSVHSHRVDMYIHTHIHTHPTLCMRIYVTYISTYGRAPTTGQEEGGEREHDIARTVGFIDTNGRDGRTGRTGWLAGWMDGRHCDSDGTGQPFPSFSLSPPSVPPSLSLSVSLPSNGNPRVDGKKKRKKKKKKEGENSHDATFILYVSFRFVSFRFVLFYFIFFYGEKKKKERKKERKHPPPPPPSPSTTTTTTRVSAPSELSPSGPCYDDRVCRVDTYLDGASARYVLTTHTTI